MISSSSTLVPVILASTSPRRIDLMKQILLPVHVLSPTTDETCKDGESPRSLVARLAREKAESIQTQAVNHHGECIILAADTIVVSPNNREILGKPTSEADAARMLSDLSGKVHTVLTGYCLLRTALGKRPKRKLRIVKTAVRMRELSAKTIQQYIATGEPMDKAGSYGAQGLGMALIESITGSHQNVVGLPISHVCKDLEEVFGISLLSWVP